jgi:hypothetical protein
MCFGAAEQVTAPFRRCPASYDDDLPAAAMIAGGMSVQVSSD